jgi:apolipoprotein D and lipocalin family protein
MWWPWAAAAVAGLLCVAFIGAVGFYGVGVWMTRHPPGVLPVQGFVADKYMGQWYEIARLENRFERGISHAKAHYALRADGGVDVLNEGLRKKTHTWHQARAVAYFVGSPHVGHLKVRFFWPIWGAYVVFFVDDSYEYACVAGRSHAYLWFLARTPSVPAAVKEKLCQCAQAHGFEVASLIWAPVVAD